MAKNNRLSRNLDNRMIGGVCSGLGDYFGIDPTILRVIWALLMFGYGIGVVFYIIAWIIMPARY